MKIKIAVAVNSKGHWRAHGQMVGGGSNADSLACDELTSRQEVQSNLNTSNPHHLVWVEADVPVPVEAITVKTAVVTTA